MNDYLWDRTGSDPEVERLERLLAPAALAAARPRKARTLAWIAGLAAAALFAVGALQVLQRPTTKDPWVAQADGLRRLDLGRYGNVLAEPGAKVRVVRMDDDLHKLKLDSGTIHASITVEARPRLFQVETPATTCIDLGCHYSLTVDAAGVSHVKVETGRVLFNDGQREIFIPQGASGRAARGRAPYTPIHDSASEPLRRAVQAFDDMAPGSRAGQANLACGLITRREDGLVAWHWLQDVEVGVVNTAREALVRLTRIAECGMREPKSDKGDERKAWRDSLFPDWKTWD